MTDDDSEDTAELKDDKRLRCFEGEVFHCVKRDRDLEKKILVHGGMLSKHVHPGVTRIVCEPPYRGDSMGAAVVSAADVRRALDAGGFTDRRRRSLDDRAASSTTTSSKRAKHSTTTTTSSSSKASSSSSTATTVTAATSSSTSATSSTKFYATAPSTKLDKSVAEFVDYICEQKDFEEAMKRFEIDVSRVLLGSLSKAQLLKGAKTNNNVDFERFIEYLLANIGRLFDAEEDRNRFEHEILESRSLVAIE